MMETYCSGVTQPEGPTCKCPAIVRTSMCIAPRLERCGASPTIGHSLTIMSPHWLMETHTKASVSPPALVTTKGSENKDSTNESSLQLVKSLEALELLEQCTVEKMLGGLPMATQNSLGVCFDLGGFCLFLCCFLLVSILHEIRP